MRTMNRLNTLRAVLTALVLVAVPAAVQAQQDTATAKPRGQHIVRKGDTLWDLARTYLSNPYEWNRIYDANRDVVQNPHWIYPAERLVIPGMGAMRAGAAPADVVQVAATGPDRTRFFTTPRVTERPTVVTDVETASVGVQQFRSAGWVQPQGQLSMVGRVERVTDPDTEDQELTRFAFPFERLYVTYGAIRPAVGDSLMIATVGEHLEGFGDVIRPSAVVQVLALADQVFTARIVRQFDVVKPGHLVLPIETMPRIDGMLAAPVIGPEGRILAFQDEHRLPAPRGLAFISIGENAGVKIGDELQAYVPARTAAGSDTILPPEPVGMLRVVKTSDTSATALITHLYFAALEPGTPVQVIRTLR